MNPISDAWPIWLGRSAVAAIMLAAISIESAGAQDATATHMNLSQALQLALDNNPTIEAANAELSAIEAESRQAGLWDNPTVGADFEDFGGDRRAIGDADTTLSVRQTIPVGGDRARARDVATAWAQAARANLAQTRSDLLASTAQAYIATFAASETLAVRQELLELANNSSSAILARVEAGRASPIERSRAEILVGLATIAAQDAETAQRQARNRLYAIWSGDEVDVALGSPLQSLDVINYRTAAPADWISNNPELVGLRAVTLARSQEIRRERAEAIPDLTIGAGWRRYGGTDESAFIATVEMPIPVLNRNQGGIAAAASRENGARFDEDAARRTLMARFAAAAGRLERARTTFSLLDENILPATQTALDGAQFAYREGALDVLNLLDIQRSYFDARINLISARAELASAAIELDALAGTPQLNQLAAPNSTEAAQ